MIFCSLKETFFRRVFVITKWEDVQKTFCKLKVYTDIKYYFFILSNLENRTDLFWEKLLGILQGKWDKHITFKTSLLLQPQSAWKGVEWLHLSVSVHLNFVCLGVCSQMLVFVLYLFAVWPCISKLKKIYIYLHVYIKNFLVFIERILAHVFMYVKILVFFLLFFSYFC